VVFAGQPAAGESKLLDATPCADDVFAIANADPLVPHNISGSGAVFVLGGNSSLRVSSGASERLEIFTRSEGVVELPSIVQQPGATAGTAFTTGSSSSTVVHGMAYLPESTVAISGTNQAAAPGSFMFPSGLVFSSLDIDTSGEGSGDINFVDGPASVPLPRTTVIRATEGGRTTTAVLTIEIDHTTYTVDSWNAA
jgi:hypothetical protein